MIDWGDVPTWLAFIAAVAAGVIAVVPAIAARKELTVLLKDREQQREDRRRTQASQFAVWFTNDFYRERAEIHRVNASGLPVWDATVWLLIRDQEPIELVYNAVLGPSEPRNLRGASEVLTSATRLTHQELIAMGDEIRVAVQFRDCDDNRWVRRGNGSLVDATEKPEIV